MPGVREILAVLREHGMQTSGAVADRLGTWPSKVTRDMRRLRRQGYVEHVPGQGYRLVDQEAP